MATGHVSNMLYKWHWHETKKNLEQRTFTLCPSTMWTCPLPVTPKHDYLKQHALRVDVYTDSYPWAQVYVHAPTTWPFQVKTPLLISWGKPASSALYPAMHSSQFTIYSIHSRFAVWLQCIVSCRAFIQGDFYHQFHNFPVLHFAILWYLLPPPSTT